MNPFRRKSVPEFKRLPGMGHGVIPPETYLRAPPRGVRDNTKEESVDWFSHKFKEEIQKVRNLTDLAETLYKEKNDLVEVEKLQSAKIDEIEEYDWEYKDTLRVTSERIKELEQNLTASTRFLPNSLIKTYQEELKLASQRYQETRDRLMPKKKFGFNARKKKEAKAEPDESSEGQLATETDCTDEPTQQSGTSASTSELTLVIDGYNERYILEEGKRVNKREIILSNMDSCFIEIRGHPSSVRMENLTKCAVLCGPTTFSIYGEKCHQNIFAFACQQFRLYECIMTRIFLHVTTRAVIEYCLDLEFGCYNYKYDGLEQDFNDAGLDINENHYADVGDFDWLSKEVPSPFWFLSKESLNWDELRKQFKETVMKSEGPIEST